MADKSSLEKTVKKIFREQWTTRKSDNVPSPENIVLGRNDAIEFDRATVLYADLSGSTSLVDTKTWYFAAEIYKAYLHCAAEIIRGEGGVITAYDGDRVMGIFVGAAQTTPAARCALKINYAVSQIVNPALKAQYPDTSVTVSQTVGIDTSAIRAARTGVRGDNDIVWVGRAANYAAKLTELKMTEKTFATENAYNHMLDEAKFGGSPRRAMWTPYLWSQHNNQKIYASSWWWSI